jgi:hypothetical protein
MQESTIDLHGWVRHLASISGLAPVADTAPPSLHAVQDQGLDARLWRTAALAGGFTPELAMLAGKGPLRAWDGQETIEVWTEVELASMHALWRLARRHARPDLRARLSIAATWHMEHTQPDNATNRPWALHVFLLQGSHEGRVYAETLLHNALALRGHPEPGSAWVLMDAAAELTMKAAHGIP